MAALHRKERAMSANIPKGEKPEADPAPTKEMIDAGANVILDLRDVVSSWALAEAVYIAMQERRPLGRP